MRVARNVRRETEGRRSENFGALFAFRRVAPGWQFLTLFYNDDVVSNYELGDAIEL